MHWNTLKKHRKALTTIDKTYKIITKHKVDQKLYKITGNLPSHASQGQQGGRGRVRGSLTVVSHFEIKSWSHTTIVRTLLLRPRSSTPVLAKLLLLLETLPCPPYSSHVARPPLWETSENYGQREHDLCNSRIDNTPSSFQNRNRLRLHLCWHRVRPK